MSKAALCGERRLPCCCKATSSTESPEARQKAPWWGYTIRLGHLCGSRGTKRETERRYWQAGRYPDTRPSEVRNSLLVLYSVKRITVQLESPSGKSCMYVWRRGNLEQSNNVSALVEHTLDRNLSLCVPWEIIRRMTLLFFTAVAMWSAGWGIPYVKGKRRWGLPLKYQRTAGWALLSLTISVSRPNQRLPRAQNRERNRTIPPCPPVVFVIVGRWRWLVGDLCVCEIGGGRGDDRP